MFFYLTALNNYPKYTPDNAGVVSQSTAFITLFSRQRKQSYLEI